MEGAIFFSTKYGSTEQYAKWIGEASGLPVFEVHKTEVDLSKYDFLVLGSPIIYYKPIIHKWIKRNIESIEKKQIIFFSFLGLPQDLNLTDGSLTVFPNPSFQKCDMLHSKVDRSLQN